ncbi:MAG TPA: pitrilysin family protein, partial [Polyangiaceae bacterium]
MRWTFERLVLTLGAIAATGCVASRPPRLPISVELPHRSERFSNGLSIVTHEESSSPVVSIALAVATGAVDDPDAREGLAHAVEHLAFRAEHGAEPSVRIRLDRMGASFNAWTASEATVYFATAPKSNLSELVRVFVDIAKDPTDGVKAEALEAERGVLDNERRLRDENGQPGEVVDRLRALVHGNGPRGKPIGGTARSLRAITLDDAISFAANHYRPGRMTLAVSGPLGDTKALLAAFSELPVAPPEGRSLPPSGASKSPAVDADGISRVPSSIPTPELWLGWALPG